MEVESPELAHWGVKGMKWGVRRYRNKDGTRIPQSNREGHEVSETKKPVIKGFVLSPDSSGAQFRGVYTKHLTDAQVEASIKRIEMDKKLKDLAYTTPLKRRLKSAKKKAVDSLQDSLVSLGQRAVTSQIENLIFSGTKPKKATTSTQKATKETASKAKTTYEKFKSNSAKIREQTKTAGAKYRDFIKKRSAVKVSDALTGDVYDSAGRLLRRKGTY